MAARKGKCYVYLLKDGDVPIYVGKGTGCRGKASRRKHGGDLVFLERGLTDDKAFEREKYWIKELKPENNICSGGSGGRSRPKRKPRRSKEEIEMDRIGTRKFAARFLITRLDDGNCEDWGVSKVDLSRIREVAYG